MKILRTALIYGIIAAAFTFKANAQTDAQLSQYYEVPSYYNPSAIGQTDLVRIRAGARLQWVGIDNAPQTFMGVADMPFKLGKHRFGVGIQVEQESIGLYKTLAMGAQIAYQLKKWGGMWSAGLQLGFYDQSFKGSEVYIPTATTSTRAPTTPYPPPTSTAQPSNSA